MKYSFFLFKASHLTTLVNYLLILLHNGYLTTDFGFWLMLKIHMLHFLAMILLIMCFTINYYCILTHGIGQYID